MSELQAVFVAGSYLIGAIVCFVRLEGKVNANERLFKEFQKNQKERDSKIEKSISDMQKSIENVGKTASNIEGRLQGMSE